MENVSLVLIPSNRFQDSVSFVDAMYILMKDVSSAFLHILRRKDIVQLKTVSNKDKEDAINVEVDTIPLLMVHVSLAIQGVKVMTKECVMNVLKDSH